jgi:putative transposase
MKKSRFTESQIVAILKQADAGLPVKDICRQAGISVPTYYQWKSKYGGLEASDLKRVKDLEAENAKLKRMYAELALDNAAVGPDRKKIADHREFVWVISGHRGCQGPCNPAILWAQEGG